jgi:CubicO group peptidase (beta-lactamase class C family)
MARTPRSGMDGSRLARIAPAVGKHIGDSRMSGAITVVVRHGEVAHEECHGLMDREQRRPMRPDALFRMYSMTKPIVCVALLSLYEEGRFRLTDPVADALPELRGLKVFAGGTADDPRLVDPVRQITYRDVLTHTAGFTYHYTEYSPVEEIYRRAGVAGTATLADFVKTIARQPLCFQPGSGFRYGVSHDVVGRLIEVVSGRSLDAFLKERIFTPLGMKDTGYVVPEDKLDRFVSMYGAGDVGRAGMLGRRLAEDAQAGVNRLVEGPRDAQQSRPHTAFRGGTGLVSCAHDYLSFCRMMLAGGELDGARVLGRKTIELMTANHLPPSLLPYEVGGRYSPGYGYGLGVRVMLDPAQAQTLGTPGEYGWSGAAGTYFWIDPREDMIGVLMAQHQPGGTYPIAQDFRASAYQAIAD